MFYILIGYNGIYSCSGKAKLSAAIIPSLQCHVILQKSFKICWFGAQESFLFIINFENGLFPVNIFFGIFAFLLG